MKVFLFALLISCNLLAFDCYKGPFFVAGAEALKKGSCQGIAWSSPAFLVSYCKRNGVYDLKAALRNSCFNNRYLCKNQDRVDEESFWLEVLSTPAAKPILDKAYHSFQSNGGDLDRVNINQKQVIDGIAALLVFKAKDILMQKMQDLAGANMDSMEATGKLYEENQSVCEETIKSIQTTATDLLNGKISLYKTQFDSAPIKSGICRYVPWSCRLKIKEFRKESPEETKKPGEVDLSDPLR